MYSIKEIYKTIQGEGAQSGQSAVFVRFSGCNLWSGKEKHRDDAICKFCDTDFVGTDGVNGGKYSIETLITKIQELWDSEEEAYVVFTGGEPMLQLDQKLISACKKVNFITAIETNGTIKIDFDIDWICVSPKAGSELLVNKGNELKVVYPQKGINLNEFEKLDFEHFYLQPLHNEKYDQNLKKTLKTIMKYPKWKLSLQTHKFIGVK